MKRHNPTEAICNRALDIDGEQIRFIDDPSPEQRHRAINTTPSIICSLDDLTIDECMFAASRDISIIESIEDEEIRAQVQAKISEHMSSLFTQYQE